jgi:hypothetical protein
MASPADGSITRFGCDGCVMAQSAACEDCLVTFLCADEPAVVAHAVVLDLEEHRAVRRLQAAGLLPESRYRARSG